MFKTHLDGLYHQEQIRDYIREAEQNPTPQAGTTTRRKLTVAVILASAVIFGWGIANFASLTVLLEMVK